MMSRAFSCFKSCKPTSTGWLVSWYKGFLCRQYANMWATCEHTPVSLSSPKTNTYIPPRRTMLNLSVSGAPIKSRKLSTFSIKSEHRLPCTCVMYMCLCIHVCIYIVYIMREYINKNSFFKVNNSCNSRVPPFFP